MSSGLLNKGALSLNTLAVAGVPVSGGGGGGGGISSVAGDADIGAITTAGAVALSLKPTTVTAGAYTSADITVDANGRITAAANGSGGGGAVASVGGATGAVVFAGDATLGGASGATTTLTLANSGVTAGAYTNANITVDAKGRITLAANGTAGGGAPVFAGVITPVAAGAAGSQSITIPGGKAVGANGGVAVVSWARSTGTPSPVFIAIPQLAASATSFQLLYSGAITTDDLISVVIYDL